MRYCRYCGAKLNNNAVFCSKCGKKQPVQRSDDQSDTQPQQSDVYYGYRPNPADSAAAANPGIFSIIAVIIELAGYFMFACLFGIIGAVIGYKIKANPKFSGVGLAILIAGIAEIIISFIEYL